MKNEMTRRILSLVLAMMLVLSLAACGNNTDPTEAPTETPATEAPATEAPTDAPAGQVTLDPMTVENPVTYFSLSMGETFDSIMSMNISDNGDGTIHVDFQSTEKKIGDLDAALMHNLTAALNETALVSLNGQDNYGEGESSASMYIEFTDGTMATVGYSGSIPQEFVDGYKAMESFVALMTADMPVYVPQVQVMDSDPDAAAALVEIMNNTGIAELDSFMISGVAKDEFFGMTMGLSSDAGVAVATSCTAMMMTTPYGIYMATLEEGADAAAIAADFEANLNWQKFVCVAPTNAVIAQKDNMVLCFMGSDELYTKTASAIQTSGWTVVKELNNPGV